MGTEYGKHYLKQFSSEDVPCDELKELLEKFEAVDKQLGVKSHELKILVTVVHHPLLRGDYTWPYAGFGIHAESASLDGKRVSIPSLTSKTIRKHSVTVSTTAIRKICKKTIMNESNRQKLQMGESYWSDPVTVTEREHLLCKYMDSLENAFRLGSSKKLYEITYDYRDKEILWDYIVKIKEEGKFKELWRVKETVAMVNDLIEDATKFVNTYKKK